MLASTVTKRPPWHGAKQLGYLLTDHAWRLWAATPWGEAGPLDERPLPRAFGPKVAVSTILCFHSDRIHPAGNPVCLYESCVLVRTQDPFAIMCFYRNKPLRLDCGYGPEPKITALGATSAALVSVLAASIRAARGDQ
tara:strand:+ start:34 stop:447 length:414 start_codon:yes stop_codon:yes gene_type:complete